MFSFILPESSVCWVDIFTRVWGALGGGLAGLGLVALSSSFQMTNRGSQPISFLGTRSGAPHQPWAGTPHPEAPSGGAGVSRRVLSAPPGARDL